MRSFLFLQGPISPFFSWIANDLERGGHAIHSIVLSIGDRLFWRRRSGVGYRGKLENWGRFVEDFIDQNKITDLILLGEQRDYHRIAIDIAKKRNCRIIVTDFGYLRPDWITLELDGMSAASHFPRLPEEIRALAGDTPPLDIKKIYIDNFWQMVRWDMLYHLSNYFLWWLYPHYRSHKFENPVLVYLGTGWRLLTASFKAKRVNRLIADIIREKTPYFVFPLQMAHDFQLRVYSHFSSQKEAIEQVICSFANHAHNHARLLIKIHPWDNGLINWESCIRQSSANHGVFERVDYIDGGSLDEMVQPASGMVTINSTSGLTALRHDCPVMVLGEAIYDVDGLTFQGDLDAFWKNATPPDPELLDDYLRAMASTILIRGVFYARPGLDAAVKAAVSRIAMGEINTVRWPDLDASMSAEIGSRDYSFLPVFFK